MKKLMLLTALILSVSFIAAADSCTGVPLTITGTPGGSVVCGPLTFTNFSLTYVGASAGTQTDLASNSSWNPLTGVASLVFQQAFPAADTKIYYTVNGASQIIAIDAGYEVGGTFPGIQETITGTPGGPALASIAALPGEGIVTVPVSNLPNTIYIVKDVQGYTSGFENSFHTPVPEPMTFVLLGSGLLGVGLLRRRSA